ncbi:phage terminase small subunit P27 family [Lactiplantibacillus plantarum]|uniref:phage terminase small subunit P27 family n=1 Tax=Lactiplantibacillus plantarum TaxID=1590 RepID=UPI00309D298E
MRQTNAGRKRNLANPDPKYPEQNAAQKRLKRAQKGVDLVTKSPPKYLDRQAKALWCELVPRLNDMGLITVLDQVNLEAFCAAYSIYRASYAKAKKYGPVYSPSDGVLAKNPAIDAMRMASADLSKYGSKLGLDMYSRSQLVDLISTDEAPQENAVAKIKDLFGGGSDSKD